MKRLPPTPELLTVAERVVWFEAPAIALAEPVRFLSYIMTYGSVEDLRAIEAFVGDDEYRETLENAPPGIFDPRSWAYWNLKFGRLPVPPLPIRTLSRGDSAPNPISRVKSDHPFFTTTTAAAELGVTPGRVCAMIAAGRLKATRVGRDWLIRPKELDAVRNRKAGRPPNSQTRSARH
jgi:excisionase family DNA binding protein